MPRNPAIVNRVRNVLEKARQFVPLIPLSLNVQSPSKDGVLMRYLCPGSGALEKLRIVANGVTSGNVVIRVESATESHEETIQMTKGQAFDNGPFMVFERDLITITLQIADPQEQCSEAFVCGLYVPEIRTV